MPSLLTRRLLAEIQPCYNTPQEQAEIDEIVQQFKNESNQITRQFLIATAGVVSISVGLFLAAV